MHNALVPLTAALFSLPFMLFSMTGGFPGGPVQQAHGDYRGEAAGDRDHELCDAGPAPAKPADGSGGHLPDGRCTASIFGPSKYGLLPELLPERRLSWGNGILELGTFLAIILGMAAGAVLYERFVGRQGWSGAVLIGLALLGLGFSLGITRVPAADPRKRFRANFLGDLWQQIQRDAPRPGAVAGVPGEHLLLVHRPALAAGRD